MWAGLIKYGEVFEGVGFEELGTIGEGECWGFSADKDRVSLLSCLYLPHDLSTHISHLPLNYRRYSAVTFGTIQKT